jgi:hypothetical protein
MDLDNYTIDELAAHLKERLSAAERADKAFALGIARQIYAYCECDAYRAQSLLSFVSAQLLFGKDEDVRPEKDIRKRLGL